MNNNALKKMLFTLMCLTSLNARPVHGVSEQKMDDLANVDYLEMLHDVSLRIFIEDLLVMYWDISSLPSGWIPSILNILAAYSEEPEYALQTVHQTFPDLSARNSSFYQRYQAARNAKFNTFSKSILEHIHGDIIVDVGGEDTRLVESLIKKKPSINKAYVTDINMIRHQADHAKVEFVWQSRPDTTPLQPDSVDTVIMSTMLHHIERPVRVRLLSHITEILRNNGRIILVEDSFPDEPDPYASLTGLDERFLAFDHDRKLKILSFLDWWGNRLMKNSREIPLPCTFKSMEEWESLFSELGLKLVKKQYLGMPQMHTHIMAPKAILVFEKSAASEHQEKIRAQPDVFQSINRAETNMEGLAFVPENGLQINLSIGGSKIQTTVVDSEASELLEMEEYYWRKSCADESGWKNYTSHQKREWLVDRIMEQIHEALAFIEGSLSVEEVEGVGIAWAGPVLPNGLLVGPNIDGFRFKDLSAEEKKQGGVDLAAAIHKRIVRDLKREDWTVSFLNDGDAAAIAHFKKMNKSNGFLLTIGTGIGSGLVQEGNVLYSIDGFKDRIGEIGHHILYHPQQHRYFYHGVLTRGKILEHTIPCCISERLAGPALARRFIGRIQREMGQDLDKAHAYLNSCCETDGLSFSEIELAACDENAELGPLVEKKILGLVAIKAKNGDEGARSFVRETGYELGLGVGVFIKEFEREPFVNNIILSGSVGKNFGKGLEDEKGNDLFLAQIGKGIHWSLRNHCGEMNAQMMHSMDPSFTGSVEHHYDKKTCKLELIKG